METYQHTPEQKQKIIKLENIANEIIVTLYQK